MLSTPAGQALTQRPHALHSSIVISGQGELDDLLSAVDFFFLFITKEIRFQRKKRRTCQR